MAGFDTLYRNDLEDPEIIRIAEEEKRTVLTRDMGILKNSDLSRGLFVRSQSPKRQLTEVLRRLDLFEEIKPLYRCMICNGIIHRVNKENVEHLLPPNTRKHFDSFFQCSGCKRVYWQGSHYEKMLGFIGELMELK